jgi:hypothetical protein
LRRDELGGLRPVLLDRLFGMAATQVYVSASANYPGGSALAIEQKSYDPGERSGTAAQFVDFGDIKRSIIRPANSPARDLGDEVTKRSDVEWHDTSMRLIQIAVVAPPARMNRSSAETRTLWPQPVKVWFHSEYGADRQRLGLWYPIRGIDHLRRAERCNERLPRATSPDMRRKSMALIVKSIGFRD